MHNRKQIQEDFKNKIRSNTLIKIPTKFFDDHEDRDLDTPEVVKFTQKNYWIKADDPHIGELYEDADYYAYPYIDAKPGDYVWGLVVSARATKKALDNAAEQMQKELEAMS